MSHPVPSHDSDNEYPADGVTSYPHKKKHRSGKPVHNGLKQVSDFHERQMGHMMNLMRQSHSPKSKALEKRTK